MYVFDFDGTLVRKNKPYEPIAVLYNRLRSAGYPVEVWTAGDYWDHNIEEWMDLNGFISPTGIRTRLNDVRPAHVLKLSWALEPTTPEIALLFDDSEFICKHLAKNHIHTIHVI